MHKGYALLGAVAFLVGALAPVTVSASAYDRLGTIADGVHLVDADEDRFKITADDRSGVLVYKPSGELVLARELSSGEEHELVLDGGQAVVALFGGEATVEATGDGDVTELDTSNRTVELAEADGGPVDERLTVELPRLMVGLSGAVDGEARELVVEASTDEGSAFTASGGELSDVQREIAPEVLDAGFLDLHVNATDLDGTVELTLVTPVLPDRTAEAKAAEPASEPASNASTNPAPAIHETANTPLAFEVEDQARLTFDVEHGHVLDASVYDANGSQTWHVHRGPDVAQSRHHCRDVMDCQRPWSYETDETVGPQEIEHTLEGGTHLLYIRAGAVEGNLTLEAADGDTLFDDVEELELTAMELSADRSVQFDAPLLDVHVDDWGSAFQRNVTVTVDGQTAYAYETAASGPEYSMDTHRQMWPDRLEAGDVEVAEEGYEDPQHGDDVHLITADLDRR